MDPFSSVTSYLDIAVAVADMQRGSRNSKSNSEPLNIYVFKLRVPEVDLIYQESSVGALFPSRNFPNQYVLIDNDLLPLDREVESFLFGHIEPEYIMGYRLYGSSEVKQVRVKIQKTESTGGKNL